MSRPHRPGSPPAPARQPSRTDRGYRRLRALPRLAIPERTVPLGRAVEPCAAPPAAREATRRR